MGAQYSRDTQPWWHYRAALSDCLPTTLLQCDLYDLLLGTAPAAGSEGRSAGCSVSMTWGWETGKGTYKFWKTPFDKGEPRPASESYCGFAAAKAELTGYSVLSL